jgi:hypothetical protein
VVKILTQTEKLKFKDNSNYMKIGLQQMDALSTVLFNVLEKAIILKGLSIPNQNCIKVHQFL